jgi:hypothetical protein
VQSSSKFLKRNLSFNWPVKATLKCTKVDHRNGNVNVSRKLNVGEKAGSVCCEKNVVPIASMYIRLINI